MYRALANKSAKAASAVFTSRSFRVLIRTHNAILRRVDPRVSRYQTRTIKHRLSLGETDTMVLRSRRRAAPQCRLRRQARRTISAIAQSTRDQSQSWLEHGTFVLVLANGWALSCAPPKGF